MRSNLIPLLLLVTLGLAKAALAQWDCSSQPSSIRDISKIANILSKSNDEGRFSNPAIDRELENPANSQEIREALKLLKESCSSNKNLRSFPITVNGKVRLYWYEWLAGDDPNAATILYVPGGPGESGIGWDQLPPKFSRLQIDELGIGCNYGTPADFRPSDLGSENAAALIVKAVRALDLKTYIIYGHSYGTVMATILAAKLEKEKALSPPTAVVMNGILSRSMSSINDLQEGARANLLNKDIPLSTRRHLAELLKEAPGDLDFGAILSMHFGEDDKHAMDSTIAVIDKSKTLNDLKRGFSEDLATEMSLKKNIHAAISPSYNNYPNFFAREAVLCQELSRHDRNGSISFDISKAEASARPMSGAQDGCRGYSFSGYNSDAYQIRAPIYYIHGDRDWMTPIQMAKDHFRGQANAKQKIFITLDGKGHNAFETVDHACWQGLFDAAAKTQRDLTKVLAADGTCLIPE